MERWHEHGDTTFVVAPGTALKAVIAELERLGIVTSGPERVLARTHLDTFDWRVWRAGGAVVVERAGGAVIVRWRPPVGSPVTAPLDREPRFAGELPEGAIRRELAPILGVRALLPVGEMVLRQVLLVVLDVVGKTVVRMRLEVARARDGRGKDHGEERTTLQVEALTGFAREAAGIAGRLGSVPFLTIAEEPEIVTAAATLGRCPGDYSSKLDLDLAPEMPSGEAVRTVLRALLGTLRANVEGTVADLDSEFLHDLRVAVRRTRAALGQLGSALGRDGVAPFVEEFRWLGRTTGPCRDLDVFRLDLEKHRLGLEPTVEMALRPLVAHVEKRRRVEQAKLARALRSRRFVRLLDGWEAYTTGAWPRPDGKDGLRPVSEMAGEKIVRAYRRFVRRAATHEEEPTVARLHAARIDAKKLRYLLEFFEAVLDRGAVGPLVKKLKAIQDTLGDVHDLRVQQDRLVEAGREMAGGGFGDADTLMAIGRLGASLEARLDEQRRAFDGQFEEFSAKGVRETIKALHRSRGR